MPGYVKARHDAKEVPLHTSWYNGGKDMPKKLAVS